MIYRKIVNKGEDKINKQPKDLKDGDILYENKFQQIRMINPNYPFTHMKCGCVIVVPFDTEGNVYMINKYRPNIGTYLEFPRGGTEIVETHIEGGVRELIEETGMVALSLVDMGVVQPDTGMLKHNVRMIGVYVPVLENDTYEHKDTADKCTNTVVKISINKALELVAKGKIICSYTMSGITKLLAYKSKNKGLQRTWIK